MAQPIRLYQGPAPAAMSQMGAGLSEAGANIGKTWQNAYSSIGQSIGQGLVSLGQGIGSMNQASKEAQASSKMADTILKSPSLSSQILGIEDNASGREIRQSLMDQKKMIVKDYGLSGAQQFFQQLTKPMMERARLGEEYQYKMGIAAMKNKPTFKVPAWGSQGIRGMSISGGSAEEDSQMTVPTNPEDNFSSQNLPYGYGSSYDPNRTY